MHPSEGNFFRVVGTEVYNVRLRALSGVGDGEAQCKTFQTFFEVLQIKSFRHGRKETGDFNSVFAFEHLQGGEQRSNLAL